MCSSKTKIDFIGHFRRRSFVFLRKKFNDIWRSFTWRQIINHLQPCDFIFILFVLSLALQLFDFVKSKQNFAQLRGRRRAKEMKISKQISFSLPVSDIIERLFHFITWRLHDECEEIIGDRWKDTVESPRKWTFDLIRLDMCLIQAQLAAWKCPTLPDSF